MRIIVGLVWLALAAAAAPSAAAAPQAIALAPASLEAQRVARGLEAQYQAALIRDRRLADDRELQLIATYETRLRTARTRAEGRVAGAAAALEKARADYAQLVQSIALRDAASRAEIEAYRAELRGLAASATPELLEAYQRFGDGDRVGAGPVIKALEQAQAAATMAAAGARAAVGLRRAAQSYEIMRLRGEATTADVLALWDEAARLDPKDFWTQIYRARLALPLGETSKALDAANLALGVAQSPREKSVALNEIGGIQQTRDPAAALRAFEESLRIFRELLAKEPGNVERLRDVAVSLERISYVWLQMGDKAGARNGWEQEIALIEPLMRSDPANLDWPRFIAVVRLRLFDLQEADASRQLVEAHRLLKSLADRGRLNPQDRPLFDAVQEAVAGGKAP